MKKRITNKSFWVWAANLKFGASSDDKSNDGTRGQHIQNRFLSLSEGITACASHPLNSTIVAGTKVHISQNSWICFVLHND